jgi:hypothetical protein
MRKFWKRERDAIEHVLRAERREARQEMVAALVNRVESSHPVRRWSRVAFAAAMTVFMVGFFASFGGLGYAASSAHGAMTSVTKIVSPASTHGKLAVRKTQSAGQDQYGHQVFTPPVAKPPKIIKVAGVSTTEPTSGELPFTGIGLGVSGVLGLLLLALGALLRRRESRVR